MPLVIPSFQPLSSAAAPSPVSPSVSLEALWQQFRFAPNDAQRQAILHVKGPLYLPAGPGSGKTRVLLWRTINLIACHGVSPDAIFLATFTEKAADQLREGIRALLGAVTNVTEQAYDVDRMYVGTVHSLCQRLLSDRRLYPDRQAGRAPILLDDLDQYFWLYRKRRWAEFVEPMSLGEDACAEINELFSDPRKSKSRHNAVSYCFSLFNRLSEECLDETAWIDKEFSPPFSDCMKALLAGYGRYREMLAGKPTRTDFALLQQEALKVVQGYSGPPLFEHVIVDEYQDTNTIQERLYFALAHGGQNLCVVGDDDQALYRFRGATVENFVQFPSRCQSHWSREPDKIPLATNYRSRKQIVSCYNRFMTWCDWSEAGSKGGRLQGTDYAGDFFRVGDKNIHAASQDDGPAVVATTRAAPPVAAQEIASLCKRLLEDGTVENANQIAFLFPSLKSSRVQHMEDALEAEGLHVYAPRAGTFLEVPEATDMFGLFLRVFGCPEPDFDPPEYSDFKRYKDWQRTAEARADALLKADSQMADFVRDQKTQIKQVKNDLALLQKVVEKNGWKLDEPFNGAIMRRPLSEAPGLSAEARKTLVSAYFDKIINLRIKEGKPFSLSYILNRATSLDWSVLDLFYRLCGFGHFKAMFDLAERDDDEGPVCNLGLISQYLARFMEEYNNVITARLLDGDKFSLMFFASFLYALFRRGESEYENPEDPFPRGRIPFLTIHQSKGLEFPVVVLGHLGKTDKGPQAVERLVKPLLGRTGGEPLDRMSEFDIMRMYYVALSRAQNLLVLADCSGAGNTTHKSFTALLDASIPRLANFDLRSVPAAGVADGTAPRNYSFTSDYLAYTRCPRQYMVFRRYGFVPSRSQTMMFGSLVHRTLDDLHQLLIAQRSSVSNGGNDA